MKDEKSDPYRGLTKEEYIQVIDSIRQMPKELWDYLKCLPEPLPEGDLTRLAQLGLVRKIRNLYRLMPSGNTVLARSNLSEEPASLKPEQVAFLQSLTYLPSVDKIDFLKSRGLITNHEGQFVLTPRGVVARAEISAGEGYFQSKPNFPDDTDENAF